MTTEHNLRYKVRFADPADQKTYELTAKELYAGDFLGMVTLEGLVWHDQTRQVLLAEEEAARKRFLKTDRLHLPYHHIHAIEEFQEASASLATLPFLRSQDSLANPKKNKNNTKD